MAEDGLSVADFRFADFRPLISDFRQRTLCRITKLRTGCWALVF